MLGIALLIVVLRLVQLQLFQADYYRQRTARSVLLKPRSLPFVRGGIFDRRGEVLVRDEPCWDLRMDYDVIAAQFEAEQSTIDRVIRKFRRSHRYPNAHSDEQIDLATTNLERLIRTRRVHISAPLGVVVTRHAQSLLRYQP